MQCAAWAKGFGFCLVVSHDCEGTIGYVKRLQCKDLEWKFVSRFAESEGVFKTRASLRRSVRLRSLGNHDSIYIVETQCEAKKPEKSWQFVRGAVLSEDTELLDQMQSHTAARQRWQFLLQSKPEKRKCNRVWYEKRLCEVWGAMKVWIKKRMLRDAARMRCGLFLPLSIAEKWREHIWRQNAEITQKKRMGLRIEECCAIERNVKIRVERLDFSQWKIGRSAKFLKEKFGFFAWHGSGVKKRFYRLSKEYKKN